MKNVIITGGSSGIGLAAAQHFCNKGYRVLVIARNPEKLQQAVDSLNQTGSGEALALALDLSDFASVRAAAPEIQQLMPTIDILALNAGLFSGRYCRMTHGGYESMIATTHLGHFQLTHLLLENLKQSADPRIVVTASDAHWAGGMKPDSFTHPKYAKLPYFGTIWGYGQSKLANILFAREFAKRYADTGITITSFHPGVVNTGLGRDLNQRVADFVSQYLLSPAKAAETIVYLAEDPAVKALNGKYFYKKKVHRCSKKARSRKLASELWEETEKYLSAV